MNRIKFMRMEHRESQKELADYLGVDPTTLSNWENYKHEPAKKIGSSLRHVTELVLTI